MREPQQFSDMSKFKNKYLELLLCGVFISRIDNLFRGSLRSRRRRPSGSNALRKKNPPGEFRSMRVKRSMLNAWPNVLCNSWNEAWESKFYWQSSCETWLSVNVNLIISACFSNISFERKSFSLTFHLANEMAGERSFIRAAIKVEALKAMSSLNGCRDWLGMSMMRSIILYSPFSRSHIPKLHHVRPNGANIITINLLIELESLKCTWAPGTAFDKQLEVFTYHVFPLRCRIKGKQSRAER